MDEIEFLEKRVEEEEAMKRSLMKQHDKLESKKENLLIFEYDVDNIIMHRSYMYNFFIRLLFQKIFDNKQPKNFRIVRQLTLQRILNYKQRSNL